MCSFDRSLMLDLDGFVSSWLRHQPEFFGCNYLYCNTKKCARSTVTLQNNKTTFRQSQKTMTSTWWPHCHWSCSVITFLSFGGNDTGARLDFRDEVLGLDDVTLDLPCFLLVVCVCASMSAISSSRFISTLSRELGRFQDSCNCSARALKSISSWARRWFHNCTNHCQIDMIIEVDFDLES